jgi:membrane complex biogenesis BtpA family protein
VFPFAGSPVVIGMVHLLPLPGSPRYRGSIDEVTERARRDAAALAEAGFDGALLENYGDLPFFPDAVPVETATSMAAVLAAVRAATRPVLVWGVNVLRNDARTAIAVVAAAGASFLRVNVHLGAALTDQGLLSGKAHETLRARAALAPQAAIFADVRVKHSSPLAEVPLESEVRDLRERGLADALLVTGSRTAWAPEAESVAAVAAAARPAPVLVASGVTARNAAAFLEHARGVIVGTSIKRGGRTENPVDPARARALVEAARAARGRPPQRRRGAP